MTVGLDINEAEGKRTQEMAREMGGQMIYLKTDLNHLDQMDAAVAEAAKLGRVKYLVNIAGLQHIDPVEDFPMETFDLMMRVMVRAAFYLSKLCIPHMKASPDGCGVIGQMASVHGHICTKNKPVYNIAKFAQRALAQSISAEGGGKVRSFSLSTGFVKTPLALRQIPAQGRATWHYSRTGGKRGDDGALPDQGDDEPHRGGQRLHLRHEPLRPLPGGGRPSAGWGHGAHLLDRALRRARRGFDGS